MKDPQGHPIRAIEYHGEHPHSVTSGADHNRYFDFDYCRRDDRVYYHESGGGPRTPTVEVGRMAFPESPSGRRRLWLAPGEQATVDGEDPDIAAAGFDLVIAEPPNPFDDAIEEQCYWCDWCKDDLPRDNECEHVCCVCGDPAPATLEADYERICGHCCVVVDQAGVELWRGKYATQKLCWGEWGETWWEPMR